MTELNIKKELQKLNFQTITDNPNAIDFLIINTILFFIEPKNWNKKEIEDQFLPNLIKYSKTFYGGKELDLTGFRNLRESQFLQFPKIFKNVEKIIVSTKQVKPQGSLAFLNNFQTLKNLKIYLDKESEPLDPNLFLPISKLTIYAHNHGAQIYDLLKSTPRLTEITFIGGQIDEQITYLCAKRSLQSVNMTNIRLSENAIKPWLDILRSQTIKEVK